ncbi:hypothetical protein H2198_008019 [Neophaeococcomyces mojaviensis]|uniref:Uncharacterized protein n=1 Tax=Neophaeococcomyces mojaviensis TaxID=3383035 RepID=A0ACC2ZYI7_9EURO|nr:hypothetical protein H2198_008019 [Knufia sp. JES_112]
MNLSFFLWVVLIVPILNKVYDEGKELTAKLNKLDEIPPDLHDVFASILSRHAEDVSNECATLIRWVLFSLRPLRSIELYAAIQQTCSFEESGGTTPAPDTLARYLLHCSRGLVELTLSESSVVQFIHETVRDFLAGKDVLAGKQSVGSKSQFTLPEFRADSCHMIMAEVCLQYLLDLCQRTPLTEEILQEYPMAEYAARYWWQHMRGSEIWYSKNLLDLALRLLTVDGGHLLTWVQLHNMDRDWEYSDLLITVDDLAPSLYYAASIGIPEIVAGVLRQKPDVSVRGGYYGNALQAASYRGHEKVVQILVDGGADVNTQGGRYGTALQAASCGGHEKVVQILLNGGACVNAQGGEYGNALQAASVAGQATVAQMLLYAGAAVNAPGYYGSALYAASYHGHEKVVQVLLNANADVNSRGGQYGTALYAASARGYDKVVQMLIEHE